MTVVRREDGKLLAFERADVSGAWQLPQGGIERGESPRQAAWRELEEETGLTKRDVRLVDEYDGWTIYAWPSEMRRGDRLGQAHRWFFFEPLGDDIVPRPDGDEFCNWRWMSAASLIKRVVEFRKPPYQQVLGG